MRYLFNLVLFPLALFAWSENTWQERMRSDLDTIKRVFETKYAPREWKQSYSGWDLKENIEMAKGEVSSAREIKDYQRIVKKFFSSIEDYHCFVEFYSTEAASLPLMLKGAQNRYFIASLNRDKLPEGCLLQVGDELISYNGLSIGEVFLEFQLEEFGNRSVDQALAGLSFFKREGFCGHEIPQGEVILGILPKNGQGVVFYSLEWSYFSDEIQPLPLEEFHMHACVSPGKGLLKKEKLNKNPFLKKSMLMPYFEMTMKEEGFTEGEGLGDKIGFISNLGEKIWSSDPESHFHAFLFETPDGHRYGYIRIPSYRGSSLEFKQFKELIKQFENESDALIIDQMNNPGGSAFYMYALASTLTDRALQIPRERLTITQKDIAAAIAGLRVLDKIETDEEATEELGEDLDGLPVNLYTVHQMADFFRFLISQWNLGITCTSPCYYFGFDLILPDPEVRYTKPILLLINHLSFSCGDFFACIMQDNQRATLLGTRTAGAGGCILKTAYPNLFGIQQFFYTGSIAYRLNNHPIEDLGVMPDIVYEFNCEDLTQFYAPFKEKILECVRSL